MRTHLAAVGVGVVLAVAPGATIVFAADAQSAAQPAAVTQTPGVVAQVGGVNVTIEQLQRPLIEGYGLNVLLNLLQLEIAKEQAAKAGVKVTPQDIERETQITIDRMFEQSNQKLLDRVAAARSKSAAARAKGDGAEADKNEAEAKKIEEQIKTDNQKAFEQFLQNQRITRAEFGIVTETNAYLRKIAEPMLAGKISDDNLQEAFRSLYGETVKCRHIQCSNMQEIQDARARLDRGEPFAKVAQEMSRNSGTASLGGELPPFSVNTAGLPQAFKDAAFALKEGEVSNAVVAEGGFHLILLEKRIPPKAVKFEDVKESLREELYARGVDAAVKQLRQNLGNEAVKNLVINDPELKKQWDEKLKKRDAAIRDKEQIRKQMQLEREHAATQPVSPLPDLVPTPR